MISLMRIISKFLEETIEHMDTKALEKYLCPDFELESNRYRMTLKGYRDHLTEAFKSIKSIEVQKPFADIFAKNDKVAARFTIAITDLNNKREEIDINATFQFRGPKILRWWEVTYPDWQTM